MKMELSVIGVWRDDSGLRGYLRGWSIYLYSFIISSIIVCRRSIFRFNHSFLSRRVEEVLRMGADFVFRRNIFDDKLLTIVRFDDIFCIAVTCFRYQKMLIHFPMLLQ